MHAFRCGGPGSPCVSRASRCDGTVQCPGGEDERNCRATKRRGLVIPYFFFAWLIAILFEFGPPYHAPPGNTVLGRLFVKLGWVGLLSWVGLFFVG